MGIFAKRPLLAAYAVFLVASLGGIYLSGSQRMLAILLFGAGMLPALAGMICFAKLRRGFFTLLLCMLFGTCAMFCSHLFFDRTLAPLEAQTEAINITATITKADYIADYTSVYDAEVSRFGDEEKHFTAELNFDGEVDLEVGDVVTASANCAVFETNLYGYNERSNRLAHGVLIVCTVTEYSVTGKQALPFFARIRSAIAARIDRVFKADAAAMLKALLIGDKDSLATSVKRDFRRLGISHILAISGTHFSVLLGLFASLLRLFRLNKKQIYVLLVPAALLYMGISGFSASVCRAGIMALLTYLAFLLGRTRDAYTALFGAVCLLIVVHPYAVLDIGLWLSFTATFSILVLNELLAKVHLPAGRGGRILSFLFGLFTRLAITAAVFFGSLPITAICFGEASLAAPLGNLLIVPLFELFLYLAPFSVLLCGYAPVVHLTEDACALICRAAARLADGDDLVISLRQPLVLSIAACGVALTLLLLFLKLKHPVFIALPALLTLTALAVYIPMFNAEFSATDRAVFLAEGKNDGFVIASGGETLYIDVSTGASAPTRRAEYIAEQLYDPELDGYLPTHYHMLHISTFNKLVSRTHIKRLYLPPVVRESDYNVRTALAATAERNGVEVADVEYDLPIAFANCRITLTTPQMLKRSTHPVICLSVETDEDKVVYLGSSFGDTALDADDMMRDAGLVVLGQHAPVTKHVFTLKNEAVLLFANEEIADFADFPSEALALRKNGSHTYCFAK